MTTTDTAEHQGIVRFAEGLPGFEQSREFVLVTSGDLDPFRIVQGVGTGAPAFIAVDPRWVEPAFAARLGEADYARLGAASDDALLWLALVSAHADGPATVNLRAPLVINPETMAGIQLMSAESAHRIDHPLPVA
jgi:flagellar assembly factor FliW